MTDPRSNVRPGQSLSVAAAQINWINDQMRKGGVTQPPAESLGAPYTWVYAKNDTGDDVRRWGVMEIMGLGVFGIPQFESMPVLSGGPVSGMAMKWCVAVEPIASTKIGRVAVAGVVQVHASDVPKLFGAIPLWIGTGSVDPLALVMFQGGSTLKAGTFNGTWPKGASKSVTLYEPANQVVSVKNSIADLTNGCGNRFCIVSYVALPVTGSGTPYGWTLVSAEVA